MRIGVDIDDTICRTTEIVHDRLEKYSEDLGINALDIMNDDELKENFFQIYLEDIYRNVEVKKNCVAVLKRLRSKGNEIYLITARGTSFSTTSQNVFQITEEWLKNNGIEVDAIITSAYGDVKAEACKRYQLDLMIDDDPFNYKKIIAAGCKCLLYDICHCPYR